MGDQFGILIEIVVSIYNNDYNYKDPENGRPW